MCGTPEDLRHDEAASFVADALRDRPRVLDVGCGSGEVSRRLAAVGFEVTAIDVELSRARQAPGVTFIEHDFLSFEAKPFDAIVFTGSLHHILPLDKAIARVTKLLTPTGRLIIDDFDVEAPDSETLRWYYDIQNLLVATELYPAERVDGSPLEDPLTRWRAAHGDAPLHTGAEMRHAVSSRFVIRELRRGEYLHRYIAAGLPADARGAKVAKSVQLLEQQRIASGDIIPIGVRMIADRARTA
ncbi:MAG: class I SAM-dependent methyltransferase [Deltaproteobacteria bacterium]|nr:class I SAM-dependent methyltransferase [Deltaproteobacteria bacterium]